MFRMEISLNEKKIMQDGQYSPAAIKEHVDGLLQSLHLVKAGDGVFVGSGSKDDYANFGSAIILLKRKAWLLPYVDKWLWYNSNGSDREEDFVVEDVAAFYSSKQEFHDHGET